MSVDGPTLTWEAAVAAEGYARIAGLDEAGRGALAGPVVAAAVILPLADRERLAQLADVNDSKRLAARKRETVFAQVTATATGYGVGVVSPQQIDETGILPATRQAMRLALAQLQPEADYLLIDGRLRLAQIALPQQSIVRGDGKSLTIAAASIVAKVTRDRLMVALDADYPAYGFAQHKGYGTPQHLAAVAELGPTSVHRHSFAPIRTMLLDID